MTDSGWFDISRPITHDGPVYPGDPPIRLEAIARIGPDSPYALSILTAGVHLATHLDAPAHFIAGGATIDAFAPHRFMGRALVIEVPADAIAPDCLPAAEALHGVNILFKTRHSGHPQAQEFDARHAHLLPETARRLAAAGVNLVGIDTLDVEAADAVDYPVHRMLLGRDVLILEGLDLARATAGPGELIALPLRLMGAEAAPCRALLRQVFGEVGKVASSAVI